MSEDTEILQEIRDLLRVIAEPALAERDSKKRNLVLQIVGKSRRKADAILLMDGTRAQSAINKECKIDMGDLSRLVRALREASLLGADEKLPKLLVALPSGFFDVISKDSA